MAEEVGQKKGYVVASTCSNPFSEIILRSGILPDYEATIQGARSVMHLHPYRILPEAVIGLLTVLFPDVFRLQMVRPNGDSFVLMPREHQQSSNTFIFVPSFPL